MFSDKPVDITELVWNDDLLLGSNRSMQLESFKDLKQVLSLIRDFRPKLPKKNIETPSHHTSALNSPASRTFS